MSAFVPSRRSDLPMLPVIALPRPRVLALGAVGLSAAALFVGTRLLLPARAELAELPGVESRAPAIVLLDSRAERRLGYLTLTGAIENRSGKRLQNVEAVVEYFDAERKLVRVDSGLVEAPAMGPSSESAFEVHSRDSDDIASYRIRFRTLLGSALPSARDPR